MFNKFSRIAASGAFALLGAQPAWAIDTDQFGARLKDAVELLGIAIDYGSASAAGDTVTLSDFTILVPGVENAPLPGDVVFSGVAESADGGFTIQAASIADVEIDDPENGFSLSLANVAVEGIILPGSIDTANLLPAVMGLYRSMSAGPLVIGVDGAEFFSIDSFKTTVDGPTDSGDFISHAAIEGIRVDLSATAYADPKYVDETFGLEEFTASISGDSTWNPDTGRAGISDFIFAIDGLGSLAVEGSAIGYEGSVLEEITTINLKLAELARSGKAISESDVARIEQLMTEELEAVAIERFSARYEDNTLFMTVIDMIAAEQGVDARTFVSGLKLMVPMMMLELPADLRNAATREIRAFLDNPQNFTILAEPDTPVSVTALDIAEENPFALVELLNITVKSNQ